MHSSSAFIPLYYSEAQTNDRLRRQISMYVQVLCSTLLMCSHRHDLKRPVLDPVTLAFSTFRNAFQSAKTTPNSYLTNLTELDELFTHANQFMTEFAGFSFFVLPPQVRSSSAVHPTPIPLPFNALDFVLRSPIWAYPQLLPRGLLSRPHRVSKKFFTVDEDSLMVLGLANIIEFAPHKFKLFLDTLNCGNRSKPSTGTPVCKPDKGKSMVYSYIKAQLLPSKSVMQLQNRKCYIETDIRRDVFGVRRSSKSALYLLLSDLTSGDFNDLEAQRSLLRLCVSNFASRTVSGILQGGGNAGSSPTLVQTGSLFSRPEEWNRLPPEYLRCCMALHQQVLSGHIGTPKATLDAALPGNLYAANGMEEFFVEAMLTWWTFSEGDDKGLDGNTG